MALLGLPCGKSFKLLEPDNGEVFFLECLLQQRQQNKDFAKHVTNSRCQCDICSKNAVPPPHVCGDFSREDLVVVEDDNESADVEVETVHAPFAHHNFRIHQQLNHVVPMPPAAVPVPVHVFFNGAADRNLSFLCAVFFHSPATSCRVSKESLRRGIPMFVRKGNA
jgi:hypothetical protein